MACMNNYCTVWAHGNGESGDSKVCIIAFTNNPMCPWQWEKEAGPGRIYKGQGEEIYKFILMLSISVLPQTCHDDIHVV